MLRLCMVSTDPLFERYRTNHVTENVAFSAGVNFVRSFAGGKVFLWEELDCGRNPAPLHDGTRFSCC